ncbi:hypothetical protein G6011_01409 [Alternaria panax]|uniref:Uncharacterized protein n=1 Tax=Alternaria panax TaxID=48097 RepID=A0AAD4IKV4_9PLEO|nr:hypothetical protein G6011_01409 [Alternaria panax]
MGSDWHPRRHPHPHPHPHPVPDPDHDHDHDHGHVPRRTLPSFAELTSSSSDSVLHRPRESVPPGPHHHHHHHHHHQDRPASQPTPPTTLHVLDFATPNPPASFTAINHTSPHVSPTNTRIPPPPSDHQPFALSLPPATPASYSPPQPPPVASLRQDSAISHHRFDASKEAEPTLPASVLAFSYFHPAAVGNARQPNVSRPISRPVAPSSPQSPPSEYRSNQAPVDTATSPSSSSAAHTLAESSRSAEQVRDANTDPGAASRRPLPSPTLDQASGSVRHQRYNVRFNTVYTSENMPPNQRPRPDPHPTAPVPVETPEEQPSSEHTIKPSVEQAILAITTAAPPPMDDSAQLQPQNTPQVERCKNCGVRWKRPLPGENQFRLSSPAQNIREQTRLTEDYIKRLENHTKYADEAYAHWVRQHQMCPATATSPPETEAAHKSRSRSIEDPSPPSPPAHPVSAKRKSEIPHEASKYRKVVTFDPPSNTTPPVRPTAPA